MSVVDSGQARTNKASHLHSIPTEKALDARKAIGIFFGSIQEPVPQQRPEKVVVYPKGAPWVVGGGSALLIASALAIFFREQLPPNTPGFYLGLGGLLVMLMGILWRQLGAVTRDGALAPAARIADEARAAINQQIKHFEAHANELFGPAAAGAHRVLLQGVGRNEWNAGRDVAIREFEKEHRIFASVVHLVAIELAPPCLSIRQAALDLTTGTVCEEWAVRRPLSDVMFASQSSKRCPAMGEWERADKLVKEIANLKKDGDKWAAKILALENELSTLNLDNVIGDKFTLAFTGGEPITITVSDSGYSNNQQRKIAYPIGGHDNLINAIKAWQAIEKARGDAEVAPQPGVKAVHEGITEFQKALLSGVGDLSDQLKGLENVMKDVLVALQTTPSANVGGNGSTPKVVTHFSTLSTATEATAAAPINGGDLPKRVQ